MSNDESSRGSIDATKMATIVTPTQYDVLMGRGKRVSEWPGNIHFRQVITKFREMYAKAQRNAKVSIANQVIKAVAGVGGRFLAEETDGSWTEIKKDRALEKACQALREKEKPNPPTGNPFTNKNISLKPVKKSMLEEAGCLTTHSKQPPTHSPRAPPRAAPPAAAASKKSKQKSNKRKISETMKKKKTKLKSSDKKGSTVDKESKNDHAEQGESDENDSVSSSASTPVSSSTTTSTTTASSRTETKRDTLSTSGTRRASIGKKPASPVGLIAVPNLSASDFLDQSDEMLIKLAQVKQENGHCAVPPGWPVDKPLAAWCSRLRLLYREHEKAYRELCKEEIQVLQKAQELDFCFDYADWHWKEQFSKLAQAWRHNQEATSPVQLIPIDPQCIKWLEDQRSLSTNQIEGGIRTTNEHRSMLESIGIYL